MKWRLLVLVAILGMGGALVQGLDGGKATPLERDLSNFPATFGAWQSRSLTFDGEVEERLSASEYLYRIYQSAQTPPVHLYVGYYSSQVHGQMIHSPRNCLPGNGWWIADRSTRQLEIPPFTPFQVNQMLVQNGSRQDVVLYWYEQPGGPVANEYRGRIQLVVDAFRRDRTDVALIRVNVPVVNSREESLESALAFLQLAYPKLMEFLPYEHTSRTS